jgi:hypothetical protein
MSDISDQIRRFLSGDLSRDELVEDLGSRTYAPASYRRDWPTDTHEQLVRIEAANPFEEGTFGEVDEAYHSGLLPWDVYIEIVRAVQARSGWRPPPSSFP